MSTFVCGTTEIDFDITTTESIDSETNQFANGNITNTINCNAGDDCITNVNGGTFATGNGTTINDFRHTTIVEGGSGSTSVIKNLFDGFYDYYFGYKVQEDIEHLINMMLKSFGSRSKQDVLINNQEFEGNNLDILNAKIAIIENSWNITYDERQLECAITIQRALRLNKAVVSPNGQYVDIDSFGEECVTIKLINATPFVDYNYTEVKN